MVPPLTASFARGRRVAARVVIGALVVLVAAGCSTLQRNPVPPDRSDEASIPGMPDVRAWAGEFSQHFHDDLVEAVRAGEIGEVPTTPEGLPIISALAISGGGADGAFGAGFLYGWTEAGNRPEFKLVTGISIGALIAPFAFLGSDYDEQLRTVFMTMSSRDVFKKRSPFKVLSKDSLTLTTPLAEVIERVVDTEMLERVAEEHEKGRRFFVGTTDLDAQKLVVWNMGAIAASDSPRAPKLFRDVLLASASIPVAFPPVYFEVEVDGVAYDEMHVDGGVLAEFFLVGALIDLSDAQRASLETRGTRVQTEIYVIRNGKVGPVAEQVPRKLTAIASRSILTLIKSVAMGDLLRIWRLAEATGAEFHYVGIPDEYEEKAERIFDPMEMRRLFEVGRGLARSDQPWLEKVGGFDD